MAGSIFSNIDPNTTSGTDLANILNDFKDAYASNTKGTTRPTNILAGGTWVDESLEVSQGILIYRIYDGTADLELLRIDKNTGGVTFGSVADTLTVLNKTDTGNGAALNLSKGRATGNQAQAGDILGDMNFNANTDVDVQEVSSRIRAESQDNATSSAHGSDLSFSTTPTGQAGLAERLRIKNDGKVGIGTISPDQLIHGRSATGATNKIENAADDAVGSTVEVSKSRLSGNGQTLASDEIGKVAWTGKEADGTPAELAKIEVTALEDTDSGANGSDIKIYRKQSNSSTYQEVFSADDNGVQIPGVDTSTLNQKIALAHGGITQDLFTVDSATYGAFIADLFVYGSSLDERSSQFKIIGVFDGTQWRTSFDGTILNNDHVISLDIDEAPAILDVDYDNLQDQGGFTGGFIYLKIRRFPQ